VGDKVWARNERTGARELHEVTAIASQHFDKLMEGRVAGEKSALHPTPTHPFWARRHASDSALAIGVWHSVLSLILPQRNHSGLFFR
jgi:hypothetical protein